jgi:HEAT repeat protein
VPFALASAVSNRHYVSMSAADDPYFDVASALRVRKVFEVDDLIRETSIWALNLDVKPQMRKWLTSELQWALERSYPPTVVIALLHAASENPVRLRLDVVSPFAASKSRNVRHSVAMDLPLAVRASDEAAVIVLQARLAQDPSPMVREWAVFALGRQHHRSRKRRMAVVFAALSDPSATVRAEARDCVARFAWSYTPRDQYCDRDISDLVPADRRP